MDQQPLDPQAAPEQPAQDSLELEWQASEYVHHQKSATWYAGLVGVVAALLLVSFFFKLWLSMAVFVMMGIAIAVYAHRPPRVLQYALTHDSIVIEGKPYPYTAFRSFGVLSEETWHSIDLEPTQRLRPRVSILFSDEDFDAIVEHLSRHLPEVDRRPDMIERLSRRLRF
jgi:uncharacterized membrane protein